MAKAKDSSTCLICIADPIDDSDSTSWIRCDICRQWLHTKCISIPDTEIAKIASYHCTNCEQKHGPSHLKRQLKRARVKIDYVALDQGEVFAVDKSEHPHVPRFLNFEPEVERSDKQGFVDILAPEELTKLFVLRTGLTRPVLVPQADDGDTGMKLPCSRDKISVAYIAEMTGKDETIEVMDVLSQQSEWPAWNLGQWRKYFYTPAEDRDRIRNVISLEVSEVEELGGDFVRPEMVRELDLVDKVWCDVDGNDQKRPKVTVYCLMSVAGSYTDFHIDFSGTPVYYTVCLGTKTFLMYPPTPDNLLLYKHWCQEPQQNFTWLGEYNKRVKGKTLKMGHGFKVNLHKGDLFIIPSGWIHAVHTPTDAVIIGGNYLTLRDIPMHLNIYNIEKETKVPARYRFPMFNKVLWLASWYYLNNPAEFWGDCADIVFKAEPASSDADRVGRTILESMIMHLKEHYELSKTKPVAKKSIPYALVGKNIPEYFEKLDNWALEMQAKQPYGQQL